MTLEAPFISKAPKRHEALLGSIAFLLLPATTIFSEAWWAWLLAAPCFFMVGVLWLAVVWPACFEAGLRRYPGGFELRRPLRRAAFVEFKFIRRIEAVVVRDGDMGFTYIDLVVRAHQGAVRLAEGQLHESNLIGELQRLPGFDAEAYAQALAYEPAGLSELIPKRFLILDTA